MPASVRVAGAHVAFSADTARFQGGVNRMIAANRQFAVSIGGLGPVVDRFRQSLVSSVIATGAYAAGIGALTRLTAGSARAFLEHERNLVAVQKTAGLTAQQTQDLGDGIRRLVSETSSLGRPLPVAREELERIAVVAGQMNIRGTRDILAFTETVGLLTLTTDLAGDAAANALGKIIATTQSGVSEIANIGSTLTALGNAFRGGEADILSQAQFLATQTAAFQLPTQTVLGLSAVLAAGGQRPETAGTAFARVLQALTDASSELVNNGDYEKLLTITQNLEGEFDDARRGAESLARTILSGDYTQAITTFLSALSNTTADERGSIFTTLLGGDVVPTRVAGIFNFLVENFDEVSRAAAISTGEWERAIALLEEAGQFAEARQLRFLVVQQQIGEQALTIGDGLSRVYLGVAENFRAVEVAALAAGTAIAQGFARRGVRNYIEAGRQTEADLRDTFAARRVTLEDANQRLAETGARVRNVETQRGILVDAQGRVDAERLELDRREADFARAVDRRDALQRQLAQQRAVPVPGVVVAPGSRFVTQDDVNRATLDVVRADAARAPARQAFRQTQADIASRADIFTEEAVTEQREQLARATRNAQEAGRNWADTQTELNGHLRRHSTLIPRIAAGIWNFIGGPLGALNIALVAGVAAWAVWGNSVDEQEERINELNERLDQANRQFSESRSGLTPQGRLAGEALSEIEDEQGILENLLERRRQLQEDAPSLLASGGAGAASLFASQLGSLNSQIEDQQEIVDSVSERYETLRENISGVNRELQIMATEFDAVASASFGTFDRIDPQRALVFQQPRDFTESLQDFINQNERQIQNNFRDIFASPLQRDANQRTVQIRLRAEQALLAARREVRGATEAQTAASQNLERAQRNLDYGNLRAGSEDYAQAQRQVARFTKEHANATDAVVRAQERLVLQQEATDDALANSVRIGFDQALRARENAIRLARRPTLNLFIPDPEEERRRIDEGLSVIERSITDRRTQFQRDQQLVGLDPIRAAGLEARQEVEDQASEIQRNAVDQAVSLQRSRTQITNRLNLLREIDSRLRDRIFRGEIAAAGEINLDEQREALTLEIAPLEQELSDLNTTIENNRAGLQEAFSDDTLSRIEAAAQRAQELGEEMARVAQEVEQLPFRFLDLAAAARRAVQQVRQITDAVFNRQRQGLQSVILDNVENPVDRAGFAARFQVLNQYEDQLRAIENQIDDENAAVRDNRIAHEELGRILLQAQAIGSNQEQSIRVLADQYGGLVNEGEDTVTILNAQKSALEGLRPTVLEAADDAQEFARWLAEVERSVRALLIRFPDLQAQIRFVNRQFQAFQRQEFLRQRDSRQDSFLSLFGPEDRSYYESVFRAQNQFENNLSQTSLELQIARENVADAQERQNFLQEKAISLDEAERLGNSRLIAEQQRRESDNRILVTNLENRIRLLNDLRDSYRAVGVSAGEAARAEQEAVTRRLIEEGSFSGRRLDADDASARRSAENEFRELRRTFEDRRRSEFETAQVEDASPLRGLQLEARFRIEEEQRGRLRAANDRLSASQARYNDLIAEQRRFNRLAETGDRRRRREFAERASAVGNSIEQTLRSISATRSEISAIEGQANALQDLIRAEQDFATFRRNRQIEAIFTSFEPPEPIDLNEQRFEVRRQVEQIQNEVFRARREARQQNRLSGLSIRPAAGLAARFEIENASEDRLIETRSELADVQRRLNSANQTYLRLDEAVGHATDDSIDRDAERLIQQRALVAELEQDQQRLESRVVFLQMSADETERFAAAMQRLAEVQAVTPLDQVARSAQNLDDILNSVAANALQNLEQALVNVFRSGRLELDSLIEAIAIDLVQALIRAVIVANLARAALSIFGGGGGGQPVTGSGSGVGGGGPAGFRFGHSGGIVGSLPRRGSAPLRARERFAVLEEGEEILTRRDPRHRWNIGGQSLASIRAWANSLPRYHEGGVVGGAGSGVVSGTGDHDRPMIEFVVVNQTSSAAQVEDNGLRFNGDKWVQTVILRDMSRNGPITQNMRRSVLGSRI